MTYAIHAGTLILPERTLADGVIEIAAGRIDWIGARSEYSERADVSIIDATAFTVAPGFIDLHTHGGGGFDPIMGDSSALIEMSRFYARHGVTGFLASAWGMPDRIEHALDLAVSAQSAGELPGAAMLGIYLEGPFLSPLYPGAFELESIVAPDAELLAAYLARSNGLMRLLTLAPEMPGADALIRMAQEAEVVVGAGHTGATHEEIVHAAGLGVRHATHMFNAMSPLHHRTPNAVGAILADPAYTAEIICDGIHVHPAVVRLLVQNKGIERVALITDSIRAAGLPDGRYQMADGDIVVAEGSARLPDGTLAGSMLTMERAVANVMKFAEVSLHGAVTMASRTPARIIGMESRKGSIVSGHDADLTLLDDALSVVATIVAGKVVYAREPMIAGVA